ncbi:MAG: class I SAM-dependent methyltransferase [Clostridia bacterium]|nr:class I SAM-dependent methyltransferase [Clostridia bacterium]
MSITQKFYDSIASHYDKLFLDWNAAGKEQAMLLQEIFQKSGYDINASILDCACGIGTQAIGLAALGYNITASDISEGALAEARTRTLKAKVNIQFRNADFRLLSETFSEKFDIVIAMDNALPHMLASEDLAKAVKSIADQTKENGIFVGSIRDYDALLQDKPSYSPPYIHETDQGKRISFQTWVWNDDLYKLTQYIIVDKETLEINKFECEYRATRREELTALFTANGCKEVIWMFPEETGFYQPIIVARK